MGIGVGVRVRVKVREARALPTLFSLFAAASSWLGILLVSEFCDNVVFVTAVLIFFISERRVG